MVAGVSVPSKSSTIEGLSFPIPTLPYDKLYYISYLLYNLRRNTKLLSLLCVFSIFSKTFYRSLFLNNTLHVWHFKYVFRLININTYISQIQFILSNSIT